MKQGLFLYRVYILADGASVHQRIERSASILAHLANSFMIVEDQAAMGAQMAAHLVIAQFFVQQCLFSLHPSLLFILNLRQATEGYSYCCLSSNLQSQTDNTI